MLPVEMEAAAFFERIFTFYEFCLNPAKLAFFRAFKDANLGTGALILKNFYGRIYIDAKNSSPAIYLSNGSKWLI